MEILQYNNFRNTLKKLHKNQKECLDEAVKVVLGNPLIGEMKVKDLAGVRVYKFRMVSDLVLLAYLYDELNAAITLLAVGSHENFYRDLKYQIK
jgi:mRNA-degrading endonuclease RelE of RelBE toxin-antitoxin system